ncbi:fatty acid desaturase [Fluviibacterium sp. DFM31]|uniref:Fatty acid desaturase n=1 Tax=Meridianimarinicoccus marinus TaxID=3231483 RepID=A0ABV3L9V6_9RHOB
MADWKSYDLRPERDPAVEAAIDDVGWYTTPVPRKRLKQLVQRSNAKAARHFGLWLALLLGSGVLAGLAWPSWWAVPAFLVYGVIYNSADSKWHELSHGTPFRAFRVNEVLYKLVSLMTLREPVRWRWSHSRHHTHTILVGHDPEIASPRPPHIALAILGLWYLRGLWHELRNIEAISRGHIPAEVASYVPDTQHGEMIRWSRIFVLFLMAIPAACLLTGSLLPALFVGLPRIYGSFLHYAQAFTQHAGLDEDILDHRLNARTVRMNPVFSFLYTNMNYHVEHHMFPMVPFYNLPALHAEIRHDCPAPYTGLADAYGEIARTLIRQLKDPSHYARRVLPEGAGGTGAERILDTDYRRAA